MMKRIWFITLLAVLNLGFFGDLFASTIKGVVNFSGEAPKPKSLDISADPTCKQANTSPIFAEGLVLGTGQTIGNVFVRVKSGLPAKEYPAPKEAVILDQKGCRYTPHVVGVLKGQNLKILNSDGTLHNVHGFPKVNPAFNMAMPQSSKEKEKAFRQGEAMFPVKCDVHPWMEAWVGVVENPYFFVTKADGTYTLDGLPAGTYEIEAWQEKMGTQTQKVTLGANETKTQNFTFTRKK